MKNINRYKSTGELQLAASTSKIVASVDRKRQETANAIGSNHSEGFFNKWKFCDAVWDARDELGLCHKQVSVLRGMMTLLPGDLINPKAENIVFASNDSVLKRVQGMGMSTMRRHTAKLVDSGFITRKDSPNCKRYRRRAKNGEPERKFGFDLQNLFDRAPEIFRLQTVANEKVLENKCAREELGASLRVTKSALQWMYGNAADKRYAGLNDRYETLRRRCKRVMKSEDINSLQDDVNDLQNAIEALNTVCSKNSETSSHDARYEHHIQSSKPESYLEEKEATDEEIDIDRDARKVGIHHAIATAAQSNRADHSRVNGLPHLPDKIDIGEAQADAKHHVSLPSVTAANAGYGLDRPHMDVASTLGQSLDDEAIPRLSGSRCQSQTQSQNTFDRLTVQDVLRICPQIAIHNSSGISTWQDLIVTSKRVSAMLGIKSDLWGSAATTLGEKQAAIVVAYILERDDSIKSPGGYLRTLVDKANAGKFDIMRILVAQEKTCRTKATGDSSSS